MKRAALLASLAIPCVTGLPAVHAGEVTGLTTFATGTPAKAAEVNGNFTAVKTAVDDNHARITTLETGVSGLDTRVTALEGAGDGFGPLFHGDGSGGDLVISGSVTWTSAVVPTNLNFNNCTIQSGATLQIGGGTTIRCAGTFTNDGTIRVLPTAQGGYMNVPPAGVVGTAVSPPQSGDLTGTASLPGYDNDGTYTSLIAAGFGATGAPKSYLLSNLSVFHVGGSGGSGTGAAQGGFGGGLVKVLVGGALANAGTINAEGQTGAGGGGGGIVILASRTSISNTGTIRARGGDGLPSEIFHGASGGGGGGAVALIAPAIQNSGAVDVAGGSGGAATTAVNNVSFRAGGGGGGGSGGVGGNGGEVTGTTSDPGQSGTSGQVLTLQRDPLFTVR